MFAGTVALDGLLRIQVRGTGSDTVLGRVVQLLGEVERTTVPVLRLLEQRAGVWLPLVITLAGTTLFFTHDLSRAIAMRSWQLRRPWLWLVRPPWSPR